MITCISGRNHFVEFHLPAFLLQDFLHWLVVKAICRANNFY